MQTTKPQAYGTTPVAVKPPARPPRPPTFDRWVLRSLTMVEGWNAAYCGDGGEHFSGAVHAMAIGIRRQYDAHTGRRRPDSYVADENEAWDIVALAYAPADGWQLCDEACNFCGLLTPGLTLTEFLADHRCYHALSAPAPLPAAQNGHTLTSGGHAR